MSGKLTDEARKLCAGPFSSGEKSTVRSQPPHETLTKHRAAFDELLGAGIITQREFNRFGVVEFTGTAASAQIGREEAVRMFNEWSGRTALAEQEKTNG